MPFNAFPNVMSFLVCGRAPPRLLRGTFTRGWVTQTLKTLMSGLNPALRGTTPQVRTFSSCSAHISVFLSSIVLSFFRPLLCFPSPIASPPLSTHFFSLPAGFQAVAMVIVGHRQMFVIVWLQRARFYLNGQELFYPPSLYNLLFGLFIPAKSLTLSLFLAHSLFSLFKVQSGEWPWEPCV